VSAARQCVTICNVRGLHARAAAQFVAVASQFDCDVKVRRESETVNAESIMDLLMLAAGTGTEIEIITEGPQAHDALAALSDLVRAGFHEDA
tara:strand:+ start:2210 stop:2485 length:276 start_codon:yes stop_codon:yes gene_type:complete